MGDAAAGQNDELDADVDADLDVERLAGESGGDQLLAAVARWRTWVIMS